MRKRLVLPVDNGEVSTQGRGFPNRLLMRIAPIVRILRRSITHPPQFRAASSGVVSAIDPVWQNLEELDYDPTSHSIRCAGVRMYLLKIGPVAALVLSGIALCLLVLAPLGWRLGLWQYRFGLYWMMPVSGLVAAAALILSVLTLVREWSQLRLRDLAMLFIALAMGGALVYVPGQYWYTRSTVPPIHDITTDIDNPSRFSAVLAARTAERANSLDDRGPQLAELQKAAYPDVVPIRPGCR
jgi:hypothetical protein